VNKGERIEVTDLQTDMNDLKSQMQRMWKHSNELTQAVSKTTQEVEKLQGLLQDDDRSTNTGILTRINNLEESVDRLLSISERLDIYAKSAKRWFWWVMTLIGGIVVALIKTVWFPS
jgi:hypothetical protein